MTEIPTTKDIPESTIEETIQLGVMNHLVIDRVTPQGAYLVAQDESDVLLPNLYYDKNLVEEDEVDVFVYTDSEDRLIATTLTPFAMLNEFAFLECVDTANIGAFMDWGLAKDLFIPKNRQKNPIYHGDKRFIRIVKDDLSERLIGVEKITQFLSSDIQGLFPNSKVEILVFAKTPMGYKVIVNNNFEGLVYENEIFEKINVGDRRDAYVKLVRSDGKLDISLQALGKTNSNKSTSLEEKVMALLQENRGILPYNSKSDAEVIKDIFSMSKKNFKATLQILKSSGKIEIKDTGIYLIS
jgi:predicted RNA-binding protein (virulence factor B family)